MKRTLLIKTMLDTLTFIAMTFIGVLWTLPAFALLVFRVRLYKVTTNKDVITLTRQVADHSTVLVDGQTPDVHNLSQINWQPFS